MGSGYLLVGQGTSIDPTATAITGDVALTSGGVTTVNGFDGIALANMNTLGVGDVLQYNGTNWVPTTAGAGGVASVTASSPLSSSGGTNPNISLTGVVSVANGGTGISSLTGTSNEVLYSNGTSLVLGTLSTDATLLGNGLGTPLGINLAHANTWTATQTFAPSGSGQSVIIQAAQTGSSDIFDVASKSLSPNYLAVDVNGNVNINVNTGVSPYLSTSNTDIGNATGTVRLTEPRL